jgi:thymidylate kinase
MTIFLLEGMDKTGKSTAAELLRIKYKCNYIHMTAPAKFHTRESYFAEMLHTIALTAGKNVVIDRTWYGEQVWPFVYDRTPLLSMEDMRALTAVATHLHRHDLHLYYMYDNDKDAHQARLREFKEPSYDYDSVTNLYQTMVTLHPFQTITFPEAIKLWT